MKNVISVGERVDISTPLLKVHTSSQSDFDKVKNQIKKCFVISNDNKQSNNLDIVYQTIK